MRGCRQSGGAVVGIVPLPGEGKGIAESGGERVERVRDGG